MIKIILKKDNYNYENLKNNKNNPNRRGYNIKY